MMFKFTLASPRGSNSNYQLDHSTVGERGSTNSFLQCYLLVICSLPSHTAILRIFIFKADVAPLVSQTVQSCLKSSALNSGYAARRRSSRKELLSPRPMPRSLSMLDSRSMLNATRNESSMTRNTRGSSSLSLLHPG